MVTSTPMYVTIYNAIRWVAFIPSIFENLSEVSDGEASGTSSPPSLRQSFDEPVSNLIHIRKTREIYNLES